MGSRGLIGLLVVTVAAVVIAVYVTSGGSPATDPLVGTRVLPQVAERLGDVGQLALVRGDTKITLQRHGNAWLVEERGGYPAAAGRVRATLLGLADLRFVEPKTRKPALYSRLEVEDAGKKGAKSTLVTVTDEKGSLLGEVIAGKRRIDQLGDGNDGIYVRRPGDAQSWLASGSVDLSGDTAAWLEQKILDLPEAQVKQVVLTAADGATVTIARAKPTDPFTLVDMPAGKKLKTPDALDDPVSALADLELADVQPAKAFVFPSSGLAHARYESFSGLVVTLDLVDRGGTTWMRAHATGTGASAAQAKALDARLAPWVYALAPYKAKTLETKMADLVETPKPS